MIIKKGVAISNGIVMGRAYPINRNKVFIKGYKITDTVGEVKRLLDTVSKTSDTFTQLKKTDTEDKISTDLYDAYKLILEDELFIGTAKNMIINEKINAEYALKKVRDHLINTMLASKNEYIKERIYDLEHIYQRIQRDLTCTTFQTLDDVSSKDIVVSHDLNADDIKALISKKVRAFATDIGGKTSHNAIIAKSGGLIGVVALNDIYSHVNRGDTIIIDGFLSTVIINPDTETIDKYNKKISAYEEYIKDTLPNATLNTKDNSNIRLYANIESNDDIVKVNKLNLLGVHLYRTEFLFINNPKITEEEQYTIFKSAAKDLKGKELILRTYDLGGDKFEDKNSNTELNPVLGLRAVRYCMKNKDFFKEHLRAILRASAHSNLKILLPMITSIDEFLSIKLFIDDIKLELTKEAILFNQDIKLGMMVELPAVAITIEKFFKYADFFSLGTNDLIQYTLGVDRTNANVENLYTPLHPAIISLLSDIYNKVSRVGKDISICGELAGDYRFLPILLGIGYRDFSMNVSSVKIIRKLACQLDTIECMKLVNTIKRSDSIASSDEILSKFLLSHFSTLFS